MKYIRFYAVREVNRHGMTVWLASYNSPWLEVMVLFCNIDSINLHFPDISFLWALSPLYDLYIYLFSKRILVHYFHNVFSFPTTEILF